MKIRSGRIQLHSALAALLIAGVVSSCGGKPADESASAKADPPVADTAQLSAESVLIGGFTTEVVKLTPWHNTSVASGRIALDASATEVLGSIVDGRVVKVYVSPGDRVQRGQVLVAIHSHEIMDARASLGRAKAAMSHSESEMRIVTSASERAERLFNIKALSQADLERARGSRIDAQAQLDAARFELERAESFLDHLVGDGPLPPGYDEHWVLIRAPLNGQVVTRSVQPGNVVLPGATLMTVSQTSSLTLIVQLPETNGNSVGVGAPVNFTVDAYGDHIFSARVIRVLPSLDSVTRTVEVQAAIAPSSGKPLRPEMFANVEIKGIATAPVRTIPAAALLTFDGAPAVIEALKRGDGLRLRAVPVKPGRRTRELVEIVSGIDTGQLVVVNGAAIAKGELLKRRGG